MVRCVAAQERLVWNGRISLVLPLISIAKQSLSGLRQLSAAGFYEYNTTETSCLAAGGCLNKPIYDAQDNNKAQELSR